MYYSPFNQFQNYSIRQESITRVTGEEGAKAYQMAPNSSAALFDGNEDIFFLKTTDGAGFPTIRKFKFEEIQEKAPEPAEGSDYITREEFEQFREEMRTYGEQYIQKSAAPATVVRRYGQNYQLQGNGITLTGPGYYDIAAGATLSGSAAGTITLAAYQDGVAIPGMTASQTVKAAGDIVTLGVSGIIRTYCTKPVSTLTIVVSGMAATGTNLAIDITKQ